MVYEECGQPLAPPSHGEKAKRRSVKCKQCVYRKAKCMNRITTPLAPTGDVEHELEAVDVLTAIDFEAMVNGRLEDYVNMLKRMRARFKGTMFSADTPSDNPIGISKRLLALTREIERSEGNPAQGMTMQEDLEDDDDDEEFRPEAI